MGREIKLRGWSVSESRWVYGNLVKSGSATYIVYDATDDDYRYAFENVFIPVLPESVGQYTGLKDKNGKEIYEGDIVETVDNELSPGRYIIHWREDVYMMVGTGGPGEWLSMEEFEGCELLGNIHQNPELLKGGENG